MNPALYVSKLGDDGVGSTLSRLTHSKAVKESVNGSKMVKANVNRRFFWFRLVTCPVVFAAWHPNHQEIGEVSNGRARSVDSCRSRGGISSE